MTADSQALQGNLFGGFEEKGNKPNPDETISSPLDADLCDKDLVEDAKSRPRDRQEENPDKKVLHNSNSNSNSPAQNSSDLPRWSHHELVDADLLTPVLKHYVELKIKNPDRVLLYRLGDFFECFFEDAIKLSNLLELALTSKEGGKSIGRVPMAGIPHHAAEKYCSELIRKGLSVALCDQLEATPAKGSLIKRDITRVLTPGTVIEEGMLQAKKNNWLAAVVIEEEQSKSKSNFRWSLAQVDVSTGEFFATQNEGRTLLNQELSKLQPSELLLGGLQAETQKNWCPESLRTHSISNTPFSYPEAERTIKNHYRLNTINGIGLQDFPLALRAAGGLLKYLKETKPIIDNSKNGNNENLIPLDIPQMIYLNNCLVLDAQTRRNLELTETQRDGHFHGSLLWAIDRTLTSMGGRKLRQWIESPLIEEEEIVARQKLVTHLIKNKTLRKNIRKLLRSMSDLERLAGRAAAGQAGARDMVSIAQSLEKLPKLANNLISIKTMGPKWFKRLINVDKTLIEIAEKIRHKLIDYPPLSLSEGGLIHNGVDDVLDGLRNLLDDQDRWLHTQEKLEREKSKNQNLKLQYHRTFGYFIAVSKVKAQSVPNHWIRRQTLANEERFITPELKEREGAIFQSKARAAQREYEIFCNLRELVGKNANSIREAARSVASLDAITSLAEVAIAHSYCKPNILKIKDHITPREINIKGSRHPVVEQMLAEESFIPNDLKLGNQTDLIILTGPNASGKSCYLRQIGLIQLLAQIGSWVPAEKANLSIADRIFTRVGAVDDLAAGQSTFIVEMSETAVILNQASSQSLVLLDEIGRGTSTFDGLAIAWSVSEFLAKEIKCRAIFATHYHELNELSKKLSNIKNYQVLVEETGEELVFLHRVIEGGASRSYGIEAARLAGVPNNVIDRANEILNQLQN